jgi:endonuclease-3
MVSIKKVIDTFKKEPLDVPLEVFKDDYKILISTLLSSRTKDETTFKAAERLFKKAPNFKKLNLLKEKEIETLIYPVGFYKTKAKHLKELSKIILKKYQGKIPMTRTDLVSLPGVGRKTANLVLNRAFKKPAIAVDTHVHKISNLLGWVKTKTPDETEKELIKIVPKKYWKDINRLFVSIGRQYNTKEKLVGFLKEKGLIGKQQ